MEKIFLTKVDLEQSKWADKDVEQEGAILRKHILIRVKFRDMEGGEIFWYPKYTDLQKITLYLVALHGDEVIDSIFDFDGVDNYFGIAEKTVERITGEG